MIIAELKGGLGNQLFQYAAGLGLANYHNVDLKVDISSLKSPDEILGTYRKYALTNLMDVPQIATAAEITALSGSKVKQLLKKINAGGKGIYKEKHFHYTPAFWENGSDTYLRGNFQSEQYFLPFKNAVVNKIQFNPAIITSPAAAILQTLKSTATLAIHVRRGDYVSNKIANDVLGVLPLDYYMRAYETMLKSTTIQKVLVFSDDAEWVKSNLTFIEDAEFVNTKGENSDLIDFYLMQHCSHNIVANSSFSWWAAYLNPNPDKIVIAPKHWFNKAPYDTKDLIPENWIRI